MASTIGINPRFFKKVVSENPDCFVFFFCYSLVMNNIEEQTAEMLVVTATDCVSSYYEEGDWNAGIVAVLARALEIASGRKLKSLEEIYARLQ